MSAEIHDSASFDEVAGSLAVLGGLLAFRYRRMQPEVEIG